MPTRSTIRAGAPSHHPYLSFVNAIIMLLMPSSFGRGWFVLGEDQFGCAGSVKEGGAKRHLCKDYL